MSESGPSNVNNNVKASDSDIDFDQYKWFTIGKYLSFTNAIAPCPARLSFHTR